MVGYRWHHRAMARPDERSHLLGARLAEPARAGVRPGLRCGQVEGVGAAGDNRPRAQADHAWLRWFTTRGCVGSRGDGYRDGLPVARWAMGEAARRSRGRLG